MSYPGFVQIVYCRCKLAKNLLNILNFELNHLLYVLVKVDCTSVFLNKERLIK